MNDNDAMIQEKEAIIAQKDQDMRAMEKRYKTYRILINKPENN